MKQVCNYKILNSADEGVNLFEQEDLQNKFLNPFTGACSVMSQCKHYGHISCVAKYKVQQEAN